METAAACGAVLAYEVHGAGKPVVFLHGLTFDRTLWRPIVERMDRNLRCILIDLPGHGESAGPPRPMTDLVEAIHDLLDELEVAKPVLVGHSFAAVVAVIYAGTYPVAGVVNVDQTLNQRSLLGFLHHMEDALRGDDFAGAFEPFRRSIGVDKLPEPMRSTVLQHQTIRQDLVLGYWDEGLRSAPEEMQKLLDDVLDTLSMPYLAIFGDPIPDGDRAHLHQHVASAQIEEWPGNGHMVHLMEPSRFAQRVSEFARACSADAPAAEGSTFP